MWYHVSDVLCCKTEEMHFTDTLIKQISLLVFLSFCLSFRLSFPHSYILYFVSFFSFLYFFFFLPVSASFRPFIHLFNRSGQSSKFPFPFSHSIDILYRSMVIPSPTSIVYSSVSSILFFNHVSFYSSAFICWRRRLGRTIQLKLYCVYMFGNIHCFCATLNKIKK